MSCASNDYNCIAQNCSGNIGEGDDLFNYWNENDCPAAYSQIINTNNGLLQYNPTGQQTAQEYVSELFYTYFQTNTLTDDITSNQFNVFQFTLEALCTNTTLPGICAQFLESYCPQFTRQEAIDSPVLRNFCGCYVEPDQKYLQYTLGTTGCQVGDASCRGCTAGETGCTGQPACDPLCHRAMTSQLAYDPTGNFITCPQSICVIDDVTVNVEGSQVPGGINFNSVCSGCGGASGGDGCLCVVSGVNVSATMSQIGVGTNFNQFCGGSSVCIVEDNEGNIISEGGCTGINPINIDASISYSVNLGIVFIIIILVLLVFFVSIAIRYT
jgi:hypothetical protein